MNKPNPLTQPTYQAAMLQSQAFRALANFMSEQLSGFNISLSEWKLLGHLNEVDNMTPSQIAKLLSVKLPISSRLLKSLEEKGFLLRKQNPEDNRVFHAYITAKGKKTVCEIEVELRRSMRNFLADIDKQHLAIYLAVLAEIANKV